MLARAPVAQWIEHLPPKKGVTRSIRVGGASRFSCGARGVVMSGWSCPHDLNGICQRVQGAVCDPGMRGCVLHGKVVFASEDKNMERRPVKASQPEPESKAPKPASRPRRGLPF